MSSSKTESSLRYVESRASSLRYVEWFPADDKPGLARPGRNRNFIKIYFWTGTRHRTLRFFSAHAPLIKKNN